MPTPSKSVADRRHVVLLGAVNAGKSTLFNALTGQGYAIVSSERGTTTDPVSKTMELIPFGPVALIDTGGLADDSALGLLRMDKTRAAARRADAVIRVIDAADPRDDFGDNDLPHITVLTKCDLANPDALAELRRQYPDALLFSAGDTGAISAIHRALSDLLASMDEGDPPLLGDLVPAGGTVILVTPIDSEAPGGRLILPQVQAIRDCLDHGIVSVTVRETELAQALRLLPKIDLVVTDSQAFAAVAAMVDDAIPLTSFSMLLARQRGDFAQLMRGVQGLANLPDHARILLLEGCTHNATHDDIGRVKIPAMLRRKTGRDITLDVRAGYDFPAELSGYDAAIQCGSCMLSAAEIRARGRLLARAGVPLTNYGIALAWGAGILERCIRIFREKGIIE